MTFKCLENVYNNKKYYCIERDGMFTKVSDSIFVVISNANYYEYFNNINLNGFKVLENIEFDDNSELIGLLDSYGIMDDSY